MGDYFQTIVDQDASLDKAKQLASKIHQRLVDQGIVEASLKNCVLSSDGMGYPPGHNYKQVVDEPSHDLFELEVNGLEVIVGRTVFDCGQGGFELTCPYCQKINENNTAWANAVTKWYEGTEKGILKCPHCHHTEPVTEWHYQPAFGFGNLGLVFWNWSPLTEAFIAGISQQLGHRTVYVTGKL